MRIRFDYVLNICVKINLLIWQTNLTTKWNPRKSYFSYFLLPFFMESNYCIKSISFFMSIKTVLSIKWFRKHIFKSHILILFICIFILSSYSFVPHLISRISPHIFNGLNLLCYKYSIFLFPGFLSSNKSLKK